MNFPGKQPALAIVPDKLMACYRVFFSNDSDMYIEADEVVWGSWSVRFYTRPSDTEYILVNAFNQNIITEIREVVDKGLEEA